MRPAEISGFSRNTTSPLQRQDMDFVPLLGDLVRIAYMRRKRDLPTLRSPAQSRRHEVMPADRMQLTHTMRGELL